jgi:hypothetical protein
MVKSPYTQNGGVNVPITMEGGKRKTKKFASLFGSRSQVMNGTAFKTSGNLTKKHLMYNKWGRIVSRKKHNTAKKEKRLEKAGFFAKKGKFGFVKKDKKKKKGGKTHKAH